MLNRKQIVAKISSIGNRQATLNKDIQETLLEINGHVIQFGEVSLYEKLLNNTKGANRLGIAKWIAANGAARLVKDKWELNQSWLKEHRNGAKTDSDCAEARKAYEAYLEENPLPLWYEDALQEEEESIAKVWDALTKAESLIADIAKKTKKGEGEHLDVERYLRAAIEQYKKDRAVFDQMAAAAKEA